MNSSLGAPEFLDSLPLQASQNRRARLGDIVTIDLDMRPENGYVPEPLFDSAGRIQFVLGWGNYLPGLHELVQGCVVGDSVQNVSVDAGWGAVRDDLMIRIPRSKFNELNVEVRVGSTLKLKTAGGIQALTVLDILEEEIVLDANAPLAGSSYSCSFTVVAIDECPTEISVNKGYFDVATFALGCFWGAELAFLRHVGVIGTKVGYSQGITNHPTYQEVCQGTTQHREAVQVVYDTRLVSYSELVQLALERLAQTTSSFELSRLFEHADDNSPQYRHGFYYHSAEQQRIAKDAVDANHNRFGVEILQATTFFDAEEQHQKFLYKGGQSSRKTTKEVIRCYG